VEQDRQKGIGMKTRLTIPHYPGQKKRKQMLYDLSQEINVPMEEIKEAAYVMQSYKVKDICSYLIKYRKADANLIAQAQSKLERI
jgi:hypothetical protein